MKESGRIAKRGTYKFRCVTKKLACARASTVGSTRASYFEQASEHAQKRAAAATRAPAAARPKALSMVISAVPLPQAVTAVAWKPKAAA